MPSLPPSLDKGEASAAATMITPHWPGPGPAACPIATPKATRPPTQALCSRVRTCSHHNIAHHIDHVSIQLRHCGFPAAPLATQAADQLVCTP